MPVQFSYVSLLAELRKPRHIVGERLNSEELLNDGYSWLNRIAFRR